MLTLLAILIGLIAAIYLGLKLHDKVYAKALEAARVDIGRELKQCAARFSHQPEIVAVLDLAAEMALCGCEIDGAELKMEMESLKTKVCRGG